MGGEAGAIVDESQVLVIGQFSAPVLEALRTRSRPDHVILDLVNIPDRRAVRGLYRGVCW